MSRLTFARHLGLHAAKAAGTERTPLMSADPLPPDDAAKLTEAYREIDQSVEQAYKQAFNSGSLEH